MSRLNAGVEISHDQRAELERLVAASTTPQRLVKRAMIVCTSLVGPDFHGTVA
jgi:hypothetical protein